MTGGEQARSCGGGEIRVCDECGSAFLASSSKMMGLCPECASLIYGYENCDHVFEDGMCVKCLWDGSRSDYTKWLLAPYSDTQEPGGSDAASEAGAPAETKETE